MQSLLIRPLRRLSAAATLLLCGLLCASAHAALDTSEAESFSGVPERRARRRPI